MINKPLSKVKNGDVFDLGLANNLIQRIEYAADLLKRGSPLAGNDITILQQNTGKLITTDIATVGELIWEGRTWGGPDGWSGNVTVPIFSGQIKTQTIRFENIKRNFNGNFGSVYVGRYNKEFALQVWNSNAQIDDGFNIFLNDNFLGSLFFDFDVSSGGFYATRNWKYGIVPSYLIGGFNIDLNAAQTVIKTIPRRLFII